MNKLCFVIMGFGKKTDYSIQKTYNLDATYKNIIKPAVEQEGYRCIRADEIKESSLIDKSMYALLIKADLVIADITTLNPNAIYELGIRHASRSYSTIIMKDIENSSIPFDLNHCKIFPYFHMGDDIGTDESKRCQLELRETIKSVMNSKIVDSPLYEFIPNVNQHDINDELFENMINELAEKEESVFVLSEKARIFMKQNDFVKAAEIWKRLSEIIDNDDYYVQQQALCTYKSEQPNKTMACIKAIEIIGRLNVNDTNDPETLGISGAIYKNLWFELKDQEMLRSAIKSYKRGFHNTGDHYTGGNYAFCLDLLSNEVDEDEKTYCKFEAKSVRTELVDSLLSQLELGDTKSEYWKFATLSTNLFALKRIEEAEKYEKLFYDFNLIEWERTTYESHKKMILNLNL